MLTMWPVNNLASTDLHSSQSTPVAATKPLRLVALRALLRVIEKGQSLTTVREYVYQQAAEQERGYTMELVYGVLRWRWKLDALLIACMDKPLRKKEKELQLLLYIALYELGDMQTAEYAVVDETVKLTRKLRKSWASALVNAVLRRYQREAESLKSQLSIQQQLSHPDWLIKRIKHDWPEQWRHILNNNNARADICLRINRMQTSRAAYLQQLQQNAIEAHEHAHAKQAVVLQQQLDVASLPGYQAGEFSVQDAGAQFAAEILNAQPGEYVLDLCAAPGGKSCHMLERAQGDIELLAVDSDVKRLQRVSGNLQRLRLKAATQVADASSDHWHQKRLFDRILLDVPCTATGVIRRHPDIKSLRRDSDVESLVKIQAAILQSAWSQLKSGGSLLYATCSLLKVENSHQVLQFLQQHDDARLIDIDAKWGIPCEVGRQLLPGADATDGFYYALLEKC